MIISIYFYRELLTGLLHEQSWQKHREFPLHTTVPFIYCLPKKALFHFLRCVAKLDSFATQNMAVAQQEHKVLRQ